MSYIIVKKDDPPSVQLAKTLCNEYLYRLSISQGNQDSDNMAMLANMILKPLQDFEILSALLLEKVK